MKTVKISSFIGNLIIVIGFIYVAAAIISAVTGYPIFAAIGGMDGAVFATAPLALAKGAEKVVKVPFDIIDGETATSKKPCLIVLFEKGNEVSMKAFKKVEILLGSLPGFGVKAWPSYANNPDKDKYIAIGTWASNREILLNYQSLNAETAREIGERNRAERKAEKAAKKGANKAAISAVASKMQAIKDMVADGTITKEAGTEALAKLAGF